MNHSKQTISSLNHIAIAMDGNGRWANRRGLPRSEGHKQGALVANNVILHLAERGLNALTLYAFSVENWNREPDEVRFLLEELIPDAFIKITPVLVAKNIQFRLLGEHRLLPTSLMDAAQNAMIKTNQCDGMKLNIAVGYSGRREILHALRQTVKEVGIQGLDLIDETSFARHLYTGDTPDPDLYIRCGNFNRISNFMLWQMAYTELFPLDVLWPDFKLTHLDAALVHYNKQKRKFGQVFE